MAKSTALSIANALIQLSHKKGNPVSNMKLQKLVYFSYGWFLAIRKERLFEDEIQAWKYGPVIPELYHSFKLYYSNPIPEAHYLKSDSVEVSGDATALLESVWQAYGDKTAIELVDMTHKVGTPWEKTFERSVSNSIIKDELISAYFDGLLH